jgi:5-(carboxyamino)imidazole ribonucleotide mutase
VPVATFAIGEAGAANAALHVIANLATTDDDLRSRLDAFRARQTEVARAMALPITGLPGADDAAGQATQGGQP